MKLVLIADDNPGISEVLTLFLEGKSINILSCRTTTDALAKIKSEKPTVIVADLNIPPRGGVSFIQSIQALLNKNQHLIVLSGQTLDENEITNLGADLFFTKPCSMENLAAQIVQFMNVE